MMLLSGEELDIEFSGCDHADSTTGADILEIRG